MSLMWYFFSCVLVTYHEHFKCYQFWRFAASSWDPEATGAALAAKTQGMQAADRRVLWAHGFLTLPLFILKFSPKSGKYSKSNIFNSELLLWEDGWFHESGPLSINKYESIVISTVGSLLKEHVFLSSDCLCTWAHTHIQFPSLSDCHFNTLSWDSLGFKEQKPYRVPGNIIMNMVKNN